MSTSSTFKKTVQKIKNSFFAERTWCQRFFYYRVGDLRKIDQVYKMLRPNTLEDKLFYMTSSLEVINECKNHYMSDADEQYIENQLMYFHLNCINNLIQDCPSTTVPLQFKKILSDVYYVMLNVLNKPYKR